MNKADPNLDEFSPNPNLIWHQTIPIEPPINMSLAMRGVLNLISVVKRANMPLIWIISTPLS